MAEYIGRGHSAAIALEDSRGTAMSTIEYTIPWSEFELNPMDEKVAGEPTQGVIEDADTTHQRSQKWSEGSITAPVGVDHIGQVLKSALGSSSSTTDAPEAGVNTHEFSVAQNAQHPSLTIFHENPNTGSNEKVSLAMISSLEFTFELGSFMNYSMSFTSKRPESTSGLSFSTTTETRMLPQHATIKTAADKGSLSGASNIDVRSASISIEKNLESDFNLGSEELTDINNTQFVVTGEIEAVYRNDSNFFTPFSDDTQKALEIDLTNSGVTIGSSTNPSLNFKFPAVTFTDHSRSFGLNDLVTETVSFKALYDVSNSEMVNVKLINTDAGTNY